MLTLILITAILLAIAIAALGIRIWIKGEFAESEIGRNENMRKRGIFCVKDEEMKLISDNKTGDSCACSSCGYKTSCPVR